VWKFGGLLLEMPLLTITSLGLAIGCQKNILFFKIHFSNKKNLMKFWKLK
jgi:hypothetical protein